MPVLLPDCHALPSPRLRWYNPMLDPYLADTKMTPAMREAVKTGVYSDGTPANSGDLNIPGVLYPFNLVSSLCEDGMHRPLLDIDWKRSDFTEKKVEMKVAAFFGISPDDVYVVPSTSHWHSYVPSVEFAWGEYQIVLGSLVDAGLLEDRYVSASLNREQTLLRPPHIMK